MGDFEGYVYLPADPRLIRCAKNIINAQVQAIRDQAEKDFKEIDRSEIDPDFATYSTSHDGTDLIFLTGESIALQEAKELERIAEATGVTMQKVREIKSLLGISVPMPQPAQPTRMEDRMGVLRDKCNKLAFRLSKVMDVEVREIHCKFKKQKDMSEDELVSKQKALITQISIEQKNR